MKRRRRSTEPSAIELIESAVHLLRRTPPAAFAIYYLGTIPFVLGLLFFWAHTTWFFPSSIDIAWTAVGLTGLFIAMKALQSEFCARLLALQLGAAPPAWSWRRFGRLAQAQLVLQPWAFVGAAVAAVLTVPFGWVYAYGQIATVLGDEEHAHSTAIEQAKLWPFQNHLALSLIGAITLGVFVNLLATLYAVPWLANRVLGVDNMFGWEGWKMLNTTFLASVAAVTWLAVDPLVKAFYTLWVFRGRSRRTGDDIRLTFSPGTRLTPALLLLAALVIAAPAARLVAAPPPSTTAAPPAQLDGAINDVLGRSEYAWRLRPLPQADDEAHSSATQRFLRRGARMVVDVFRAIARTLRRWVSAIARHLWPDRSNGRAVSANSDNSTTGLATIKLLLYGFIGAVILLLVWVAWSVWRQAQRYAAPAVAAQAIESAQPDLRDENVQAAQLPTDGWLALAREQAARGEWRLAWRALYLATLAGLATEGLISLARFKTNLDYERELRRRALSRTEIVTRFARRRRAFEDVWYGRAVPGEQEVRQWMAELEAPASP